MKKLFLLLSFLLAYYLSFAQYPVSQALGAPKTLVMNKGGFSADSALIVPSFPDTNYANLSPYVKYYPGNIIRAGNQLYFRNATATAWIILAQTGTAVGSVQSISQGYGIEATPNPITISGFIKVDTSTSGLSGKYVRIVDTSAMLNPYLKKIDTTNKFVNNITRTVGKDSIIFYKGSNRYAIKDSTGVSPTTTISTTAPLTGGGDLSTNRTLGITQATTSTNGYVSSTDFNKFSNKVDTIYRTPNKDSIQFTINSRYRAIKDSIGVPPTRTISTTIPLTGGGNLSSNISLSINPASTNTSGYLSSTDWNTFNSKVPNSRTITINGTAYDLSADRTWNVGTVTSVSALTLGTTGTDLSSTVVNGSTTPTITLNVPTASATNRGALSSTDFNKFSNKVDTIYRTVGKDSIQFKINGRYYAIKDSTGGSGTITKAVDTIYRTPGKDSIQFTINGKYYAIKDSSGGSGTVTTAVDTIYRTAGKDSIQFTIGGRYRAIRDSVGGYFTKNIIMNGTSSNRLGNYVNGDTIPVAGLSLDSAFKVITQKAVPPTYIPPTATISSSPSDGSYEIGSALSLTFSSTFTQNDAGSLISTTYYKNNTSALAGNTDAIASLTSTTQYKVTKTYNQGACKTNNLGQIDCTGRINAGSVSSSNISFTPYPKRYWGYTSSGTPSSSDVITAAGGGSELTTSKDKYSFSVVVTGTNQYVYYAYPSSYGALTSIVISGLESIGAFNQTTVSVTNAQGYTQNYYVYTSQNQFNNTTVTFTSVN